MFEAVLELGELAFGNFEGFAEAFLLAGDFRLGDFVNLGSGKPAGDHVDRRDGDSGGGRDAFVDGFVDGTAGGHALARGWGAVRQPIKAQIPGGAWRSVSGAGFEVGKPGLIAVVGVV